MKKYHPGAKEVNPNRPNYKPLIIGLVTIGVLLLLGIFLLFQDRIFAGQAIGTGIPTEDQAGIIPPTDGFDEITVGTFTVPIKANIGTKNAVGVEFTLRYDSPELTVSPASCAKITEILDAYFEGRKVMGTPVCTPGLITLEYAGLCGNPTASNPCPDVITDNMVIAEVDFVGTSPGSVKLEFARFNMYDLGTTTDFITDANTFDAELMLVAEAECTSNDDCPSGQSCNANGECIAILPPSCTSIADCSDGEICLGGRCVPEAPGCTSDDDCKDGKVCDANGDCVAVIPPGPTGIDLDTLITATVNIPEATVYTILKDADGVILVFKAEKIYNLAKDSTYDAVVNYPDPTKVVVKEVTVQDKFVGFTIYGSLVQNFNEPSVGIEDGIGVTLQ